MTTSTFEIMGTRSTARNTGLIDIRTFTLHHHADYKLRDIGNWVLNQELPVVTQYS